MKKVEIIDRLSGLSPAILSTTPYAQARNIPPSAIQNALASLSPDSTWEDIKLLVLLDLSREIQSIATNMMADLTDTEVADRAEKAYENLIDEN
ncbi:hypothetical protein ACN4EG_20565 [Alkalinema pantanalense CENA528]|uniref:hypothetical protein n=1 Tax=Alkalinema pantanalense TaxID=1620705 RepID=UPI003D6F3544